MDISAFGRNLKRIRIKIGMSQTEFAKVLNVRQQQISRLELCQVEPSVNFAFAVVRKFDISWEELLDGIE